MYFEKIIVSVLKIAIDIFWKCVAFYCVGNKLFYWVTVNIQLRNVTAM